MEEISNNQFTNCTGVIELYWTPVQSTDEEAEASKRLEFIVVSGAYKQLLIFTKY